MGSALVQRKAKPASPVLISTSLTHSSTHTQARWWDGAAFEGFTPSFASPSVVTFFSASWSGRTVHLTPRLGVGCFYPPGRCKAFYAWLLSQGLGVFSLPLLFFLFTVAGAFL